jgi:hypothetical protein
MLRTCPRLSASLGDPEISGPDGHDSQIEPFMSDDTFPPRGGVWAIRQNVDRLIFSRFWLLGGGSGLSEVQGSLCGQLGTVSEE